MTSSVRRFRQRSTIVGLALAVAGILLLLLPAVGFAAGVLPYSVQVDARSDQLGTTSTDLSGATFNELRSRVVIIDNLTNRIHEYDTDASGSIVVGPRRTLDVTVGGGDLEGIAWITGDDYALLSENTGIIELITIPDDVSVTSIDTSLGSIDTTIEESVDGFGAEGIAVDRSASNGITVFWVTREKEPALFQVDSLGNLRAYVPVPLSDASGVYASAIDDSVFVVSDESQLIVQLQVDTGAGTATVLSSMALPDFEQAEAITFNADQSSLYVFGESPTDGLTHARYQGPVVPTPTATTTPEPTATATAAPEPTPTATAEPTTTPEPTAEPTASATPAPTATEAPMVSPTLPPSSPIAAPADPGTLVNAPAAGNGAFGFGAQPQPSAAATDAATGVGGPGLAATGQTTHPTAALGIVLIALGAPVVVAGRRRMD